MPRAQIKGVRGFLGLEHEQELIRQVTDAVDSVAGEGQRSVTRVIVEDVEPGAWGVGGTPITGDELQQMAAQGI